jgi:hypothetical protein
MNLFTVSLWQASLRVLWFSPASIVPPMLYIHLHLNITLEGRAMAQAVSRRPLNTEARVRSQVKSVWDLWWTKWHWDRFFSELSVFPCRFHSTCATLIVKIGKKLLILIIFIGVAQKGLRLWCEGPSKENWKGFAVTNRQEYVDLFKHIMI